MRTTKFSQLLTNKYRFHLFNQHSHFSTLVSSHGHTRLDEYNNIRYDKRWQKRIIAREEKIFKKWSAQTIIQQKHWREHVFKRTDPGIVEQIPE